MDQTRSARELAKVWIYRWFDDRGQLLYVGISAFPKSRIREHYTWSWWVPMASEVLTDPQWHPRFVAEQIERKAIGEEGPIFNTAYAPGLEARIAKYYESRGINPSAYRVPGSIQNARDQAAKRAAKAAED